MKKLLALRLFLLFSSVCSVCGLFAQDTEFWFVVPDASNKHSQCDRPIFFMITTGSEGAMVSISMPAGSGFSAKTQYIAPNSFWKIDFTGSDVDLLENSINTAGQATSKGILITSSAPVSAYYQLDGACSKDIFALKGKKALGTQFFTPFQDKYSRQGYVDAFRQIHIVATENNTTVNVTPTGDIVGTNAGQTKTVTLQKGQTFLARERTVNTNQLNGSFISSDKPVAVTVADDPVLSSTAHDMTGDQLVPVNNLGTNYVAIRGYTSAPSDDNVYILATEDGTQVYVNGSSTASATLSKGTSYRYTLSANAVYLTTNKPAYCYQQSGVGNEFGAALLPSMYSINARRLSFYKQNIAGNSLFLIFRAGNEGSFLLNNSPMTISAAEQGTVPGLSDWKYARVDITNKAAQGQCVIENTKGSFALGYFLQGSGTALYGFLSNFGQLELPPETYKCPGESIVLDAGYAKSYLWSTGETTSSITVTEPGEYWVEVDQDPYKIKASTKVIDDYFGTQATKFPSKVIAGVNLYFNAYSLREVGKVYTWDFDGGNVDFDAYPGSNNSTGYISWSTLGKKKISLKVESDLHCDTTLYWELDVIDAYGSEGFNDYYGAYNDGTGGKAELYVLKNDTIWDDNGWLDQMRNIVSYTSSAGSILTIGGNMWDSDGLYLEYHSPDNFFGIDTIRYESTCVLLTAYSANEPNLKTSTSVQVPICNKKVEAFAYVYVYPNMSRVCHGSSYPIRIDDKKFDVTVDWFYHKDDIHGKTPGSTANTLTSNISSGKDNFVLDTEVTFNGAPNAPVLAFNNTIRTPYTLDIVPTEMYWIKGADNNWNNPQNWTDANGNALNTVPLPCTNVYIAGNAGYYPSLEPASTIRNIYYGEPECNNIKFHFGAELGKPHYLTYNRAYINYNFGYYSGSAYMEDGDRYSAAPMSRGRWYALAAPLKKIVSGDFSVGGYPNMWQQGFRTTPEHGSDIVGEWYTPEANNALEIGAKQHYSISIWAGEFLPSVVGEDNHKNLNALKGIFEMPYFENSWTCQQRRIHNRNAGQCEFSYYYFQTPNLPIESAVPRGCIKRGNEAYRFVFENESGKAPAEFKMTVPAGDDVMIGNPFTSSLNFIAFYQRNSSVMESYYRLYENASFTTYNNNQAAIPIAPLQGFFIKTKGVKGSTVDLYFPLETASVVRNAGMNHQLKSSSVENASEVLIHAKNNVGSSQTKIVLNNSSDENIPQLFAKDIQADNTPQLYLLDEVATKHAVYFTNQDQIRIPLGIKDSKEGLIEISIPGVSMLKENGFSVTLYDKERRKEIIPDVNSPYKFTHNPERGSRFEVWINKLSAPTGFNQMISVYPGIYMEGNKLNVVSSEEISGVVVSTVHGVRVFSDAPSSVEYTKDLSLLPGVYIVTVKLNGGKSDTGKIIVK